MAAARYVRPRLRDACLDLCCVWQNLVVIMVTKVTLGNFLEVVVPAIQHYLTKLFAGDPRRQTHKATDELDIEARLPYAWHRHVSVDIHEPSNLGLVQLVLLGKILDVPLREGV